MESKNLVICDPETKFASAFAQYLTRQKELAVRVRTCSDLSYVLAIQEKEKIDFLFISSEYPEDSRKQVKAGMVFVIAPEREVALENREVPIYKYQPGDQILAEMIRQCSMSGDEKQIFLKITGKKNCRVIAVYSPVRRIGKTTYAKHPEMRALADKYIKSTGRTVVRSQDSKDTLIQTLKRENAKLTKLNEKFVKEAKANDNYKEKYEKAQEEIKALKKELEEAYANCLPLF